MTLAAIGGVVGLAAAAGAVMRLLGSLLFGVSPFDPMTYGLVGIGLRSHGVRGHMAAGAQATRIDPMFGAAFGMRIKRRC